MTPDSSDTGKLRDFYTHNPRMVSSPFGGVEGFDTTLLEKVLSRLDIPVQNHTVLDVGCGRGFARDCVRAKGGRYFGMDFVISGAGFPLVQGDAANLPVSDSSIDQLWCIDASEHFPEPQKAASEFFRVLRPGGCFFLSAPNYSNVAGWVKRREERSGRYAPDTWAPFGRWQAQELEQALTTGHVLALYTNAGFRHVNHVGHGAEVGLGLFPWIDHPDLHDRYRFRLQRFFRAIGDSIAAVWPGASLHCFYRFDKPTA